MKRQLMLLAWIVVATLTLTACGGSAPDQPTGPAPAAQSAPETTVEGGTNAEPSVVASDASHQGAAASSAVAEGDAYVTEVEQFRADRESRLKGPYGWASLIGLFWLEDGDNTFGSDPDSAIVLPADAAPPLAGRFVYNGSSVRMIAEPGVTITIDDEPVLDRQLAADATGHPDVLQLGRLQLIVLDRGGRHGIRVKDPESPARKSFAGLTFYPVDPAWRIQATLRRTEPAKKVEVASVIGTPHHMFSPGTVEFTVDDKPMSLEALASEPDAEELFMIFRDATSGAETYEAGRYLGAPVHGDKVTLDFNEAYNPPCVFTRFATCPLPPPGNRLSVAVRAGEKAYHRE